MFYSKLFMASIFFLLSCSSTNIIRYTQSDYDLLNEELSSEKTILQFSDNSMIVAYNVRIYRDSLFYTESISANQGIIHTSAIKEITFTDNSRGAWDGFRIGALIGLAIGVAPAVAMSGEHGWEAGALILIGLSFVTGSLYGAPIGALIGHDATYVFETKTDTSGLTQIDLE